MSDAIQEPPTAAAAPVGPSSKMVQSSALQILGRRGGRVLRAKPRTLRLCVGISTVLALAVAIPFTRYRWEPTAVILHTPVPIPEGQKSLYTEPSLPTQLSLVKSPILFEQLAREFDIDAPPEMFDKVFKVESQKGTDSIIVTLKWKDGEQGAALVNRLVELFIQQAAETRQKRLTSNNADLEIELRRCKERLAAANDKLRSFQVKERALDVKGGVERLNSDIAALETSLATARRNRSNYLAQLTKLDKHLAELRSDDGMGGSANFTTSDETVADNRRRQDRLRELIEDERRTLEDSPRFSKPNGVTREPATDEQGLRRIALRIRQQVHEPGAIILCTAAHDGGNLDGFIGDLSRYFAGRDERVLILDARVARGSSAVFAEGEANPAATGLSDYLTFRCLELTEVVHATREPAIDYLPAGAVTHADRVATPRMRELLDELRATYTLVLLIGPVLTEMVDLEILAAHAQGIAVYLDNSGGDIARDRATLHSLRELKALLLGAVVADVP